MTTVLKDKEKIVETIEELDRYKRDALRKTWEKVNGYVSDHGFIFSNKSLLTMGAASGTSAASLLSCSLAILPSFSPQMGRTSRKAWRLKSSSGAFGSRA